MSWISPDTNRVGNCCGTGAPDNCIEFEVLLHPDADAIVFDVYSGAIPPGALFYQVDCGPMTQVGEPLCLSGAGPHHLTFCKPGNNSNEYYISTLGAPAFGPDAVVNDGCVDSLWISGFDETTVTWTSIFPGAMGDYDHFLSCTSGCDTVEVTAVGGYPSYVDYMVCGNTHNPCDTVLHCDTMRVTFNSTLNVTINPADPVICYGDTSAYLTANASGGTPPYTYQWSNGSNNTAITVGVGTYIVQIIDGSGCPAADDTVVVTDYTLPISADAGPDLNICASNVPVNIVGNVQNSEGGLWSGMGSFAPSDTNISMQYNPTVDELTQGYAELTLETTGNHGCPGDADTVMVYFHEFDANLGQTAADVTCFGFNDGEVSITITGGHGPHDILWATGDTTLSIANQSPGNGSVTVTNIYGCDSVLQYYINEPPPLNLDVLADSILCFGDSTTNTGVSVSGGTPGYQLDWAGNTFNFSTPVVNEPVPGLQAGSYHIQLSDQNGCAEAMSLSVGQPGALNLSVVGPDTLCYQALSDAEAIVNGGTTPYMYSWNSGATGMVNNQSILQSGFAVVEVTDANNCVISDSLYQFVIQLFPDSLDVSSSGDICLGDSVLLAAQYSGAVTPLSYLWTPCGCTVPGPFYMHPTNTTMYVVTVTDLCANEVSDSIRVEVHQPPVVDLPEELLIGCAPFDGSFTLDSAVATNNYKWTIDGEEHLGETFYVYLPDPGTYTVYLDVESAFGCTWQSDGSNFITVSPTPKAGISVNNKIVDMNYPQVRFTSTAIGPYNYFWDFDDGSTGFSYQEDHTFGAEGYYDVWHWVYDTVSGCVDSAELTIRVDPAVGLYVPNAFTPDGDGINDVFLAQGVGVLAEDFSMQIFNRWGELIFESSSLTVGWDGTSKGQTNQAKTDVYVYRIKAVDKMRKRYDLTGHVNLLR